MEKIKKAFEELKSLSGKDEARKRELMDWIEAHKEGHEEEIGEMMDEWLEEMETDNEDIRQQVLRAQMDEVTYKLIPWSYIAKEYFGKSLSWLTQRVNGYMVRGHVYTLNDEQKQTLNRALKEVGTLIGSCRFI